MLDLHVTGYPSMVNVSHLPERALTSPASTEANRQAAALLRSRKAADGSGGAASAPADVMMITTSQLSSKLTQLGLEMSRNHTVTATAIVPRGYHTRSLAPPFDSRSTYRLDYCEEESSGFQDAARRTQLANYRNEWTEEEKACVDASMKSPFLTLPQTICADRPTMYRCDYMPEAEKTDLRTLSHKTNLSELGTTFAYSAYTLDDPRRAIPFDPAVSSIKGPHSMLEKTFSPRDSFYTKPRPGETAREELDRLRTMRQSTLQQSAMRRQKGATVSPPSGDGTATVQDGQVIVIPGMKGMGYRRAKSDKGEDYVYLPRDHFCYQAVYDY